MKVHKVNLQVGLNEIDLPLTAKALSARMQHSKIAMWYICNPDSRPAPRKVLVVGTGHPIEPANLLWRFLDTVDFAGDGTLMFHVFVNGISL